jgi:hypothetical protein
MEYALVFLAALLVGAIVYRVTLRQEQMGAAAPEDEGELSVGAQGAPPPSAAPPAYAYVPLTPSNRSWETRVSGIVGIVVIVALSAAALALLLYAGGAFVIGLFGDAATNGGVGGGAPTP